MAKEMRVISIVTAFLMIYAMLSVFPGTDWIVFTMYLASPVLVIWMVYSVLKAEFSLSETFDEQFYQDWDMKRNIEE